MRSWSSATSATRTSSTRALKDIDSVIHLAAEVGVGQSMYAVERYTSVNEIGTAVLFEALIDHPVRRVVTASSMSIYGEGLYRDADGKLVENAERAPRNSRRPKLGSARRRRAAAYPGRNARVEAAEPRLDLCARQICAGAADADHDAGLWHRRRRACGCSTSMVPARRCPIPTPACSRSLPRGCSTASAPLIFEDGEQRRDFVYVGDVARAFSDALEQPGAVGEVFNIGSRPRPQRQGGRALDRRARWTATTSSRRSSASHGSATSAIASATAARLRRSSASKREKDFDEGLAELAEWVAEQEAQDRVDEARAELEARGLVA